MPSTSLHFRPVEAGDMAWIHRAMIDPALRLRSRRPASLEQSDVAAWLAKIDNDTHRFVATRDGAPVALGVLSQYPMARLRHSADVALLLPATLDDDAAAGPLLDHLLHFGEHWIGVRRFSARPVASDAALIGVLESRGFSLAATMVDAHYAGGRFHDRLIYERLDPSLLATPLRATIGPAPGDARRPAAGQLVIRPPTPADAAGVHAMMLQDAACEGTLQLPSRELPHWVERYATAKRTNPRFVAEIGGTIVGRADLISDDRPSDAHAAAVALAIHRDHWGRGIGRALMLALLDAGFGDHRYHRIDLTVYVNNPAAVRLYEQLGFRHEGILRRQSRSGGGLTDVLQMAMLRPHWDAARATSPSRG